MQSCEAAGHHLPMRAQVFPCAPHVPKTPIATTPIRKYKSALPAPTPPSDLRSIHLSHNKLSLHGAKAILTRVPVSANPPRSALWCRLEWNNIPIEPLMAQLKQLHKVKGLKYKVPEDGDRGPGGKLDLRC